MPRPRRTAAQPKQVIAIAHRDDSRRNNPTAEMEAVMDNSQRQPIPAIYERRNRDLDPQLVWRGKDEQDLSNLVVAAPPLFTQETVQPKVLVDDLMRLSKRRKANGEKSEQAPLDLFAPYSGPDDPNARTEFYEHDQRWTNRMILGDSLQVMASLAELDGMHGKVQCIYIDPPYGIRFNSNFQWSTTSRDVRENNTAHITREPEQVKAFRDTWRDGIHSYLTYLRDRLTVARDLLADSGSLFVQIGDENVHRVRSVMDEVLGDQNFVSQIAFNTTSGSTAMHLANPKDYVLWYAKSKDSMKFRRLFSARPFNADDPGPYRVVETEGVRMPLTQFLNQGGQLSTPGVRLLRMGDTTSQRQGRPSGNLSAMGFGFTFQNREFRPSGTRGWSTTREGLFRAAKAGRLHAGDSSLSLIRYFDESPYYPVNSSWDDTGGTLGAEKTYVVQTNVRVIERCVLLSTDPGDLVLDPTCGSGSTAYVAEQWGRRWITIDTSRVALALARARIMGARYPYYLLADSSAGQRKEAEIRRKEISETPTQCNVRQGFVYERVPHITLRDIANNADIDDIYDQFQQEMEPIRHELNDLSDTDWQEWEIPREAGDPWPDAAAVTWNQVCNATNDAEKAVLLLQLNSELGRTYTLDDLPDEPRDPWAPEATELHQRWWELRIDRQKEIDASIAANANFEYLYDKPYEDRSKVRVAGPFTVESLSPHRILTSDDSDDGQGEATAPNHRYDGDVPERDFATLMLDNLRTSGVQQAQKAGKIDFVAITGWPGDYICAEGTFMEGDGEDAVERRAGIFIGPEFGTVTRAHLMGAAREAAEAGFDLLIACAFSYDAHATDLDRIGVINVLKARMNADLHMADNLKEDSKGNLFVVFGEPDISVDDAGHDGDGTELISIKIHGVDIFNPTTGQVQSDDTDGIACWFVDTDYNNESFFVRHAYFLGASNDPYKSLKTTLKAEIDKEAWDTLVSDTSRPFPKPESGRVAVKVINHLGDEAMKVMTVR